MDAERSPGQDRPRRSEAVEALPLLWPEKQAQGEQAEADEDFVSDWREPAAPAAQAVAAPGPLPAEDVQLAPPDPGETPPTLTASRSERAERVQSIRHAQAALTEGDDKPYPVAGEPGESPPPAALAPLGAPPRPAAASATPTKPPVSASVFVPAAGARGSRASVSQPTPPTRSVFQPAPGSVFEPAETVAAPPVREAPAPVGRPPLEKPRPPDKLPAVKPLYHRGRELEPVLAVGGVGAGLGILLIVLPLGWVVGVLLVLASLGLTLYRLALILDPPVRVTPEQGVREFYEALCHKLPNYRRLYLLLSVAAKEAPELGSYGAFRAYWQWRRRQLLGKRSALTPLDFRIDAFESSYNAERNFAQVQFDLTLFRRGESKSPLLTRQVATTLVKARDGAWYLNEGTLP